METELETRLAKLEALVAGKTARAVQLPFWPENKRGIPNAFIRSALFPAIQKGRRKFLKETEIFSSCDITIKFTGEQLNQEDLTLWETLVELVKEHPLGTECTFSAYSILKALKLPTGGAQHKCLHSGIIRLMACSISITHNGKTYGGSLIEEMAKDEISKHYKIKLNVKMINFYGRKDYTQTDWDQRLKLRKSPLAQALHAFYSSHKKPFPQKMQYIAMLTGSQNKQYADYKRKLTKALNALEAIGFLHKSDIIKGIVYVERAQQNTTSKGIK